MGSPARRPINPITRCRDQPHYGYAGTDNGRGNRPKRLTKTTYADVRAAGQVLPEPSAAGWPDDVSDQGGAVCPDDGDGGPEYS